MRRRSMAIAGLCACAILLAGCFADAKRRELAGVDEQIAGVEAEVDELAGLRDSAAAMAEQSRTVLAALEQLTGQLGDAALVPAVTEARARLEQAEALLAQVAEERAAADQRLERLAELREVKVDELAAAQERDAATLDLAEAGLGALGILIPGAAVGVPVARRLIRRAGEVAQVKGEQRGAALVRASIEELKAISPALLEAFDGLTPEQKRAAHRLLEQSDSVATVVLGPRRIG